MLFRSLVSRLIDGQFPNFQQVVPTSHTTRATVDRDELLSAVRLAQVVADAAAHIVRFAISAENGGAIDITAAADIGDHAAHVEAKVEGESTTIRDLAEGVSSERGVRNGRLVVVP